MAKSRSTPTPPTRPFVQYLVSGNGNGNGAPPPETDGERVARIEDVLIRMQTVLETQHLRMGDMQALIDRLTAERNRSR
jgi:hypothetical protein